MEVVFWDFDGTIVYSNSLWSNSVYKALKLVDNDTSVMFEDIRRHMAYGFTWHTPNENYSNITNEKWWDFMNRHFYNSYIKLGVDTDIAEKAVKKIRTIIKQKENYKLYNDAVDTLETLQKQGVINVLLSNNYPDLIEVLYKLDLIKYFDNIIISAVEGYDKPRKELFDIAKSKYPNAQYYMVGDSINADIKGGNKAGITTVLVHKSFNDLADYCTDNLADIINIINP